MPWCDGCDRFYNPSTLAPDGTCPSCGEKLARPPKHEREAEKDGGTKIPWHFWILLVALVVYLGWRLFQGISWVVHKL